MAAKSIVLVLLASLAGCASLHESPLFTNTQDSAANRSEDLFRLARDIEANGGGDTALELYRQAVAAAEDTPAAHVRLGDAYLRAKKLNSAIATYRAALAKDPDNADALLGLGTAFAQQGALQKSLAALSKAAPHVNTGAAYNRLGVAQTMAGQFSEAQATFEKALAAQPDDLDIATNLALAAALAGQSIKAAELTGQIAQSPRVQAAHRRNLVIVLGIIGRSAKDARTIAPSELSQADFEELFGRAASIRNIADPKERARALGTMQG
jgi:Flp pilus assembly protein TadD